MLPPQATRPELRPDPRGPSGSTRVLGGPSSDLVWPRENCWTLQCLSLPTCEIRLMAFPDLGGLSRDFVN